MRKIFGTVGIAALALAGCGGGGSSSNPPPPPPVNNAPQITSSANFSVEENEDSAGTVTATDSDGDTLTFSLSGTDAALFSISSGGMISFDDAPDFEAPGDDNGDNIYDLTVTVSDGTATVQQAITIEVTDLADNLGVEFVAAPCPTADVVNTGDITPFGDDLLISCSSGPILVYSTSDNSFTQIGDLLTVGAGITLTGLPSGIYWDAAEERVYVILLRGPGFFQPVRYRINDGQLVEEFFLKNITSSPVTFYSWIGPCASDGLCIAVDEFVLRKSIITDDGGTLSETFESLDNFDAWVGHGALIDGDLLLGSRQRIGGGILKRYRPDDSIVVEAEIDATDLIDYDGPVAELAGQIVITEDNAIYVVDPDILFDTVENPAGDFVNRIADFAPDSGTLDRPGSIEFAGGRTFIFDYGGNELFEIVGR